MLGIFSRQSTNKQKSIPFQMELGEKFAKKNNWKFEHYVEKGVSGGAKIENRKEFLRLLDDIQDGKIDKVFLWEQDRAEREPLTWHTLCETLTESGAALYENGQLVDLQDEQTYMMRGLKSLMNRLERRKTVKKSKEKLHAKVKANGFVHGVMPYGYMKSEKGEMIPHEDEAEIIKKIFQWSLEGLGYASIAHKLNDMNVPTRYNKYGGTYKVDINRNNDLSEKEVVKDKTKTKWVHGTIKNILHNETYTGVRRFADMVFEIEPIIDKNAFYDVKETIKNKSKKTGKKVYYKYLLNDLVWCKKCGKRYTGREVNKKVYYRCVSRIKKGESCGNRGVKKDILDDFIWEYFFTKEILLKEVKEHVTYGKLGQQRDKLGKSIEICKNTLKTLDTQRQNAIRLAIEGVLSDSDISNEKTRIDELIKTNNRHLRNLEEEFGKIQNETALTDDLKREFDEILDDDIFTDDDYDESLGRAQHIIMENHKRSVLRKRFGYNGRQKLIKKYIDRVEVLFANDIFKIETYFKLPIPQQVHFMDKNYYHIIGRDTIIDLGHPLKHHRSKKALELVDRAMQ